MNKWNQFKLWLAWKILGEPEEVNREVEYTHACLRFMFGIDHYEEKNKLVLKEAFLRVVARKTRDAEKDWKTGELIRTARDIIGLFVNERGGSLTQEQVDKEMERIKDVLAELGLRV